MKLFKLVVLGGLIAGVMLAGSVQPCAEEALSAYLGAGNCSIGNLVFGGFTYTPTALGTGSIVAASSITVVPVTTPGNVGLEFQANWTGQAAGGSDSAIGYFVASGSGAPIIDGADLGLIGSVTGEANAVLDEYICPGVQFSSTCTGQVHLDQSMGPGGEPPDPSGTFAPVSLIGLVKDIRVYGTTGSASVSQISNNYSQLPAGVPEPVTPLLTLGGLALLWRLRKIS